MDRNSSSESGASSARLATPPRAPRVRAPGASTPPATRKTWTARLGRWLNERLSIRQRLTLWYTSLLTLILTALVVLTYFVAQNQIQSNLNNDIRMRAISIASALQHEEYTSNGGSTVLQPSPSASVSPTVTVTPGGPPQPTITPTPVSTPDPATNAAIQRQLTVSVPDALGHLDLGFEVLDTRGRLKYLAPSLNGRALPINYAVVDGAERGTPGAYTARSDGSLLSVYAQPITVDTQRLARDGAPTSTSLPSTGGAPTVTATVIGVVLVAKSQDDVNAALATLLRILVIGEAMAIAVAVAGGWLIAERSLRPVASVTRAASAIARNASGADLGARVAYHGARDEVGELVSTFNDMLNAVQSAAETQRQFVNDASHELRTPLTSVRVNLQWLREVAKLPEDERAALDDAYLEAERMTTLVGDLLLLARVDAAAASHSRGEAEVREQLMSRREPVEIDQMVMDLLRAGETQTRASHKTIRMTVSTLAPVTVIGDPGQLRQLGRILIDNAIKYTPDGGVITLSVSQIGPLASFSVSDTGIGISPEARAHIFDRFYRSDEAREFQEHGSGLGLAIARWLAGAHGGEIKVESEPGKGSVFTVLLPVARAQLAEQSSPRMAAQRRKRNRQRPEFTLPAIRPLARLAQSVSRPSQPSERADAPLADKPGDKPGDKRGARAPASGPGSRASNSGGRGRSSSRRS